MPGAHPPAVDASEVQHLTDTVNRLRRALRASIRTDIPWEALPMAQVELLQTLDEVAPARISELAERLHLANSTVSGVVAQMISGGLVERQTDPADRRAAVVTLTSDGRAQLGRWEQATEQRIGRAFAALSEPERRAIARALPALGRLTELLNESPPGSRSPEASPS